MDNQWFFSLFLYNRLFVFFRDRCYVSRYQALHSLYCLVFFFVFFQVNKNIIDISIPSTFVEDNGKSSTAAGQMIKFNGGIKNVGLWSDCVHNEPFVGCYVEKENVESSPLETTANLVLTVEKRVHLVLASRTLQ